MEYTFLKTEAEGLALYAAALFYLIGIVIVLSRYLKIIRNKKLEAHIARKKKRKVYTLGLIVVVLCALIHTALFFTFFELIPDKNYAESIPRTSYLISIIITMTVFTAALIFGIYLKGTSTLPRQDGPVTGV